MVITRAVMRSAAMLSRGEGKAPPPQSDVAPATRRKRSHQRSARAWESLTTCRTQHRHRCEVVGVHIAARPCRVGTSRLMAAWPPSARARRPAGDVVGFKRQGDHPGPRTDDQGDGKSHACRSAQRDGQEPDLVECHRVLSPLDQKPLRGSAGSGALNIVAQCGRASAGSNP